ncbi:MAG: hypothetical protein M3Q87_11570, partial [Actinomycetota bacterium]|nr:hypothetical protein [Actinomycetota bacterium]
MSAPRPTPPRSAPARPGPPRPAAHPPAAAQEPPAAEPTPTTDANRFGRVAADGTVYVRSRDGVEREVGRWPDGDPVESLALYTRRFEGLAVEVALLERRVRRGALSPSDARAAVDTVRALVVDAQAVGDLESLIERLDLLQPVLDEQRQQRRAAKVAVQE